jgi:hypothetical protein
MDDSHDNLTGSLSRSDGTPDVDRATVRLSYRRRTVDTLGGVRRWQGGVRAMHAIEGTPE